MATSYLERGEGRIAYEVNGDGPLVVLLHGMGVDRSVYRFAMPPLERAGFRVAAMDSRGHGESDATFSSYDDAALAADALALIDHLGVGPALLVGHSMGAGATVIAAAQQPEAVAGTVLIGPFVRDPSGGALLGLVFRLLLARPWGPAVWRSFYRGSYPTRRPADFASHLTGVMTGLRRKWRGFTRTTRTSHAQAEARLAQVSAPTLVVMGTKDRDWPDPAAEGRFVAEALPGLPGSIAPSASEGGADRAGPSRQPRGELLLVGGAGHYPMAEFPEVVNPALVSFAQRVQPRG